GEEGISGGSFERASSQTAVVFHVADHRLYRAASSQEPGDRFGDTTPGAADENPHIINAVATIAAINKGHVWPLIGQDFDLLKRLGKRMAVVGIAGKRPHPDDKAAPVGRGHADFGAELVTLDRKSVA